MDLYTCFNEIINVHVLMEIIVKSSSWNRGVKRIMEFERKRDKVGRDF